MTVTATTARHFRSPGAFMEEHAGSPARFPFQRARAAEISTEKREARRDPRGAIDSRTKKSQEAVQRHRPALRKHRERPARHTQRKRKPPRGGKSWKHGKRDTTESTPPQGWTQQTPPPRRVRPPHGAKMRPEDRAAAPLPYRHISRKPGRNTAGKLPDHGEHAAAYPSEQKRAPRPTEPERKGKDTPPHGRRYRHAMREPRRPYPTGSTAHREAKTAAR